MQKLVRRMTRFFVKTDKVGTLQELEKACVELGFTSKQGSLGMTTVSTKDKRGMQLVFKACLIEMGKNLLLAFEQALQGGWFGVQEAVHQAAQSD